MSEVRATCRQTLLVGHDDDIAAWVRQRLPHDIDLGPCRTFGIVQDDKIVGGVVFNNFRGFDIGMTIVVDPGVAVTRRNVKTLCEYVFKQLNVRRVTAITGKKNRKARKALRILGFVEEGTAKYALDGTEDAVQYGLLREKCRWL